MLQEQVQQSAEPFNALSSEKKQTIWNSMVDKLSKIDINDLPQTGAISIDGGGFWRDGNAINRIPIFFLR